MILTVGYCHFVNVKRIQDLASAGFFVILTFIRGIDSIKVSKFESFDGSSHEVK